MKVRYVRVSTEEQSTARQEVIMQELGVEKVFIEKVSGKTQRGMERFVKCNFFFMGKCPRGRLKAVFGGRVVKSCSPFSAAKWQRQKSRRSRG